MELLFYYSVRTRQVYTLASLRVEKSRLTPPAVKRADIVLTLYKEDASLGIFKGAVSFSKSSLCL